MSIEDAKRISTELNYSFARFLGARARENLQPRVPGPEIFGADVERWLAGWDAADMLRRADDANDAADKLRGAGPSLDELRYQALRDAPKAREHFVELLCSASVGASLDGIADAVSVLLKSRREVFQNE